MNIISHIFKYGFLLVYNSLFFLLFILFLQFFLLSFVLLVAKIFIYSLLFLCFNPISKSISFFFAIIILSQYLSLIFIDLILQKFLIIRLYFLFACLFFNYILFFCQYIPYILLNRCSVPIGFSLLSKLHFLLLLLKLITFLQQNYMPIE